MLKMESVSHWGLVWYDTAVLGRHRTAKSKVGLYIKYDIPPQNSTSFNEALRLVRYVNGKPA